ncbi:hypothetical protein [Caballeronia sp. M1242]|uniref:hypothetical protein n=1 Tax=Caballeronia sp. M1242 TaxID=2814653 RepID=UPI0019D069EF|nr:hypothetical protein [Caballeronia sp. M1242]QSN62170.1 hypothetical protein JYK05_04595 [Caballeronia sp. M1242]
MLTANLACRKDRNLFRMLSGVTGFVLRRRPGHTAQAHPRVALPSAEVLALALAAEGGLRRHASLPSGHCPASNYYDLAIFEVDVDAESRGPKPPRGAQGKVVIAATSEAGALDVLRAQLRGDARCYAFHWNGRTIPVHYVLGASGLYL